MPSPSKPIISAPMPLMSRADRDATLTKTPLTSSPSKSLFGKMSSRMTSPSGSPASEPLASRQSHRGERTQSSTSHARASGPIRSTTIPSSVEAYPRESSSNVLKRTHTTGSSEFAARASGPIRSTVPSSVESTPKESSSNALKRSKTIGSSSSAARASDPSFKVELSISPIIDTYRKLFSSLKPDSFAVVRGYTEFFQAVVNDVTKSAEMALPPLGTSAAYVAAVKALRLSQEMMQTHFAKLNLQPQGEEAERAISTARGVLDVVMSDLIVVLQAIELERIHLEAQDKQSMIERTAVAASMKPSKLKRSSLLSHLPKLSIACGSYEDFASPVDTPTHDFSSSSSTLVSRTPTSFEEPSQSPTALPNHLRALSYNSAQVLNHTTDVRQSIALLTGALPKQESFQFDDAGGEIDRRDDGTIVSASLPALFRILTDPRQASATSNLLDVFFLFFRQFVPPSAFFQMLVKRYKKKAPATLEGDAMKTWKDQHKRIKIQVARILALWLDSYWKDDADGAVLDAITTFTHKVLALDRDVPVEAAKAIANALIDCAPGCTSRRGRWLEREMKKTEDAAKTYPPTEFQPRLQQLSRMRRGDYAMVDITFFCNPGGAEELARQMTIVESQYFHTLLPEEWIKVDIAEVEAHHSQWRVFSDSLVRWVQWSVMRQPKADTRAKVIQFFMSVAQECTTLRNFNSALHIWIALQDRCITRLEATLKLVEQPFKESQEVLKEYFASGARSVKYREELRKNLPAVPIGAGISGDATSSRAGLPRVGSIAHSLSSPIEENIPLEYYRRMCRTVRDLERVYGVYKLERSDFICGWIKHHTRETSFRTYNENGTALLALSKQLESGLASI